jgi:hypothetical protein
MADQVTVQLVNVDTPKIVKFLALKAKHLVTCDHCDMDAFAIQYVAIHDRPPYGAPRQRLRLLSGDSDTNRASPSAFVIAAVWQASQIQLQYSRLYVHRFGHCTPSPETSCQSIDNLLNY